MQKITLRNNGLSCAVLTYGALVQSLFVPDKSGQLRDVVLGYDSLQAYLKDDGYLGATVGRCANLIAEGKFTLQGREYRLPCNEERHHLHGGMTGFSKRIWKVTERSENSVTLTHNSPDGEEGYPGNLQVSVTYTLQAHSLLIHYQAVSDRDTVCNLTNHSYFNLGGHRSGSALEHTLQILADRYTPIEADGIPTGILEMVQGTPMDFCIETPVGARIWENYRQLTQVKGYDHNYVLNKTDSDIPAARLFCEESGIEMRVFTTLPGLQLYAANGLTRRNGKAGAIYGPYCAVCLETQYFPDSPNQAGFPSCVLPAGQRYDHCTAYQFCIR